MENTNTPQPTTAKIYSDKQVLLGTFLGGPLAAGYYIAENFKAFGDADTAKKTWFFTVGITLLIFCGIALIPNDLPFPKQIIPLAYTFAAHSFVKGYQGPRLSAHMQAGGQQFGWGRTVLVGIVGLLTVFLIVLIGIFLFDDSAYAAV